MTADLDRCCIDTIRTLSMDAIQKANSGHPGMCMGAAPAMYVLWQNHLRVSAAEPAWPNRDRFVLSAGHGSMLLYSLLYLRGFGLSLEDLEQFRQLGSLTPGHPEFGLTAGVDATTGPLGQGCGNSVGMAIAERFLAATYNRPGHTVVDHFTYALLGDGDIMEGLSAEVSSLAGHLQLGKLIHLYDANDVSLDGPTSMTLTEDVAKRYEAYGWHVQWVKDADHDLAGIDTAITAAKAEAHRPSLIILKTTIGYGSPNKAGTNACHGAPLGEEEVRLTKEKLGWPPDEPFRIPDEARAPFAAATERCERERKQWQEDFAAYRAAHPDLATQWEMAMTGELPAGWDADLPTYTPSQKLATRVPAGAAVNAIAGRVPWLMGGDADIGSSCKSLLVDEEQFGPATPTGRNIRFGVREHTMGTVANGIAYHGGIRPFTGTFFVFVDYMRPAIRMAALARLPVIFHFSHDSIGVGEDGPTHQPVEQVLSLRCIPGLHTVRPCDANEAVEAWRYAMARTEGPTALIFTRQKVPTLDRAHLGAAAGLRQGAYVLWDPKEAPVALIIATGSEVAISLEAAQQLSRDGLPTRLVSMPCWESFAAQATTYQESVLPPGVTARLAVEAGVHIGWERWVGGRGAILSVDRFGLSCPNTVIFRELGFSADNIAARLREVT